MKWEQLANNLGLNRQCIEHLKGVEKSCFGFESIYEGQSNRELIEAVKKYALFNQLDYREVFGYVCLELAVKAYERYKEQGISDEVYYDTMKDLMIWTNNCYKKFGVWGIDEYEWLMLHVQLKIFKLGRLQFEPKILHEVIFYEKGIIEKGEKVLNVHIPEGEPLSYEKCKESYKMARLFFEEEHTKFICSSWVLDPIYKEYLPEGSNIVRFQRDYYIYEIDNLSTQAEERIFGEVKANVDTYEQNTTLQRIAVTCLKEGKKLGLAKGVLKFVED